MPRSPSFMWRRTTPTRSRSSTRRATASLPGSMHAPRRELTQQINYAAVNRGLSYESEGSNRNVPVNFATVAERDAAAGPAGTTRYSDASATLPGGTANLLAGTGNHASADAPFGIEDGYIFNAVLQAGGTVRNYGFLVNNIGSTGTRTAPVRDPFGSGVVQVAPLDPALAALTDVYF